MKTRIGVSALLAMMAITPLAHADYLIDYQIGSGAIMTCLDNSNNNNTSGTVACSGSGSGVVLTNLTGSSNSPGTPTLADEFSASGSLVNNNTTGSETITIWYAAQGYTMPVTGGGVTGIKYASNSSGTSIATNGTSTLGLESCVGQSTSGVGANFCTGPFATLTNPTLTYPAGLGGSVNNSVQMQFSPLTATYVLSQEITIQLAAGDSVNYSMSQALTPVPEPMSITLLGGVLLLTTRAIQRRRKQQNNISA